MSCLDEVDGGLGNADMALDAYKDTGQWTGDIE